MNFKEEKFIAVLGLLLSAFALLAATLLGFGGFNVKAFSSYQISGFVSRLQMVFILFGCIGFVLSGIAYENIAKRKIRKSNIMLLAHLPVSIAFLTIAIFGLTSQLRSSNFWGETTFQEIQDVLFFNGLTLLSFLTLGILQVILFAVFSKTKMFPPNRLSKTAQALTLISGIFLIVKTIIDYPPIKQVSFVFSYTLKIPFPNNIVSIVAPLIYLSAQIFAAIIILQQKTA